MTPQCILGVQWSPVPECAKHLSTLVISSEQKSHTYKATRIGEIDDDLATSRSLSASMLNVAELRVYAL
jgi:hypothetical protein